MTAAYLLVSHGSRDRRPQLQLERLACLVRQQIEQRAALPQLATCPLGRPEKAQRGNALLPRSPSPLVGTATLECAARPLHQQVQLFARRAALGGGQHLAIVPLFLLAGVHVREDLPREIALAQAGMGKAVMLDLRPHLGSYPSLSRLLACQFSQLPAEGRILLSHGSRRPQANRPVEILAAQSGAVAAYWSVPPSLAEQVEAFGKAGRKKMAIAPYFLFEGGITQVIAQQVQQLQANWPTVKLLLGKPLGPTPELAQLILEGVD